MLYFQTVTMRTAGPATGPPHTFPHFVETDSDTLVSRFRFCAGNHPTNPFVPRQRGDVLPQGQHFFVGQNSLFEIRRHFVDGSAGDLVVFHGFSLANYCGHELLIHYVHKYSRPRLTIFRSKKGAKHKVPPVTSTREQSSLLTESRKHRS